MTAKQQLPIDVVPKSDPPIFRWQHVLTAPVAGASRTVQECEGSLPVGMDQAVADLILMAKRLLRDNASLQGQVNGMTDRIVAQSELLSKKVERPADTVQPPVKGKLK